LWLEGDWVRPATLEQKLHFSGSQRELRPFPPSNTAGNWHVSPDGKTPLDGNRQAFAVEAGVERWVERNALGSETQAEIAAWGIFSAFSVCVDHQQL
jgi:hypothetical protein